ncbi:MAG: hydroxyethylthiazole kinase-like uncharacterized protein yjeF [Verrucomicrobiales bacterium]|jgi:hydroxyethylthiazole kinase-like uncharacterized protein yjeF
MLVTCQEMRALEDAVFARGISADSLMERVGAGMAQAVQQWFPKSGHVMIFSGNGHNAGDAFVAARHLANDGWSISVRFATSGEDLQPLTMSKFRALGDQVIIEALNAPVHTPCGPLLLMDGLLGIGAAGELRGSILDASIVINNTRQVHRAQTIAIDIPTGVNGDTGAVDSNAVIADYTLTVAAAKKGLVADAAINHVGRLEVISIEELEPSQRTDCPQVADRKLVRSLLPRRAFDSHKGTAGRVGIIAGSVGFSGAARLAATAALHSGAGLVTLFVPEKIWSTLAVTCPPEVMVRAISTVNEVRDHRLDVIGIGPGLGDSESPDLLDFLLNDPRPMVIDADALNAIARKGVNCLRAITAPRLLTPHPGEMERLQPSTNRSRTEQASVFSQNYPVSLLLKGARTVVASAGKALTYNTTGCPGMASGGMGDALTGICSGLIAQGLAPHEAGILGSWLLGRAAEIAISDDLESNESLTASAVIRNLGRAFILIRRS